MVVVSQVGEKLGKAEVEKRQAIDNEDYDKAKSKKQQMDEYRLLAYEKLRVNDLLDASMMPVSVVSDVSMMFVRKGCFVLSQTKYGCFV